LKRRRLVRPAITTLSAALLVGMAVFAAGLPSRPPNAHFANAVLSREIEALGLPAGGVVTRVVTRKSACIERRWDGPERIYSIRMEGTDRDQVVTQFTTSATSLGWTARGLGDGHGGVAFEKRVDGGTVTMTLGIEGNEIELYGSWQSDRRCSVFQ